MRGSRTIVGLAVGAVTVLVAATAATAAPAAGSPDPSFGNNGTVTEGQSNSYAGSVYRQPDGELMLPAEIDGRAALVRLSGAGAPDQSFGLGGVAEESVNRYPVGTDGYDTAAQVASRVANGYSGFTTVTEASDGTYYAGGYANSSYLGGFHADGVIAHVLANGSLDPGFGQGGVVILPMLQGGQGQESYNCTVLPVALAALPNDQGVVVSTPSNCAGPVLREFDVHGQENQSFATQAEASLGAWALYSAGDRFVRAPDGDLLVDGCPGQPSTEAGVVALRPDGSVDTSYGDGGCSAALTPPTPLPSNDHFVDEYLAPGPDGGLWLAVSDNASSWMARLTAGGQPDPSFGTGTATMAPTPLAGTATPFVTGLSVADTGDAVLSGSDSLATYPQSADTALASVLSDGGTDTAFATGGLATVPPLYAQGLEVQPYYRVVVSGTAGPQGCAYGGLDISDPADQGANPAASNPPQACTVRMEGFVDPNP